MTGRVQVDWLVFTRVWDGIREYVQAEFGETEGYLSRTVETAMRESIGEHRYEPVERKVRNLVAHVGAEKTGTSDVSTFAPTAYNEKTRIGVYVDKALLRKWKRHVDEHSQYSYGVALSQHLAYYLEGGRPASLVNQLDRVIDEIEADDEEPRSTAAAIINRLDERFSLEDFHAAARKAGVNTTEYALKQHLPRVIDEMEVAPLPSDNEMFVPKSSMLIPDVPNPALLPYHAMADDDKRLVIKIAAIKAAVDDGSETTTFSVSEGVTALGGRPQQSTVRALMRDLDPERIANGISYDDDRQSLIVKQWQVKEMRDDHNDALSIITRLRKADGLEDGQDSAVTDWVERAAELLADFPSDVNDPVINNKIVRAKFPGEVDDIEGPSPELRNRVTLADQMRVKEELGWTDNLIRTVTTGKDMDWQGLQPALAATPDYEITDA